MTTREPIAIVGIAGLFPQSLDVAQFWNHVLRGADLISDVPATHWSIADHYDADPKTPDKTYARRGGFLPAVPFDPLKEGMPPSLLPSTDTSQLLGLLVARVALDEAFGGDFANAPRDKKERVSCLLGVTSGQELFGQMAARLRQPEWRAGMKAAGIDDDAVERAVKKIGEAMVPWTEATFPGLLGNVVAGRIANRLDLGGTNAVTDAACASSFAALSMAIDELVLGRADTVLCGGVDTLNDVFMHMCFSKTPALSMAGDCRPFDKDADGTLLGEGLGMVALKRLSDAERDGNVIYAKIMGLGTSSDGKSKSVYAPVPEGQAKALRRAYAAAGYSPATVELVEAHGTGTKAGDAAEIEGLRIVFDEAGAPRRSCAIGSVKSQIGHTKAAAGAAGFVKAALALSEKVIPATLKVTTPNPSARFEDSAFFVSGEARPWVRGSDHPRRASVSSFGFGGSNFHVSLEEYVGPRAAPSLARRDSEVVALSAASAAALVAAARSAIQQLDAPTPAGGLAGFAASVNARFNADEPARAAFVAASTDEVRARLSEIIDGKRTPQLFVGSGPAPVVAALFPGQGSQSLGMAGPLAMALPVARAVFDGGADVIPDVVRAIFPPSAYTDAERTAHKEHLTRTENAQPALALAELATWRALEHLGVSASMAAGHSFGELVALCAAGAIEAPALFVLARRRGELMRDASSEAGAMAAVIGAVDRVPALLQGLQVVIANHNAPDQCVISGRTADVDRAATALKDAGLTVKRLQVSTAFHSPLVEQACGPFHAALEAVRVTAPRFPVYANTSAAPHGDAPAIRRELARQIGAPVRFVDDVRAMYAAGARVFVEVGPGTVLSGLAARICPDATVIATDVSKGTHGLRPFMTALARLCALGVPVRLAALPQPAPSRAPLVTKTSLMITGANVGKPALPAPAPPPRRAPAPVATSVAAPTHTSVPATAVAAPPATPPAPSRTPMTQKPTPVSPSFLDALRESQRTTAEAHIAFQRALADAHAHYLSSVESTQKALLAAVSGGAVDVGPARAFVSTPAVALSLPPAAAPMVMTPAAPVVAHEAGHKNGSNGAGYSNGNGANGSGHPKAPVLPAPAIVAPLAVRSAASPRALLLEVVADKTGYPVDALQDGMSLEADLGIDSIKRVEILGALKDKLPQAGQLDALKLAQLKTLGEIAHALGGAAPSAISLVAPAAVPAQPPTQAAATGGVLNALLEVVADKTGYPKDALSPSMALEADLGVDSIKRVEILSALKEKVPTLPPVDAVKLAQLGTLGEIAQALEPNGVARPF